MKLSEHYQDGGPSVEFYDVRETAGPGSLLDGDVEFYLEEYSDFKGSPPEYGAEQVWLSEAV